MKLSRARSGAGSDVAGQGTDEGGDQSVPRLEWLKVPLRFCRLVEVEKPLFLCLGWSHMYLCFDNGLIMILNYDQP
jgi:hypothetical protein